ncbi:MAG: glycoside hydrolase family 5 protein [Eubacterium sp.]|nr:glycoside hydrolase family 5 protein [Eubacterium sp.]
MKEFLKKCSLLACAMLTLGIMVLGAQSASAKTPLQKWGRLQVEGRNIVNSKGKKVQIKGVSTHGIAWFGQYVNKSAFKSMRKMGANTIRLALYSDKESGYSKKLYKTVDKGVKAATELGMYVILDWHILNHGNPKTDQKKALKFFKRFAKKYGKQKNVIYEICNEPNGDVKWERDIKPYAEKVIKKIRKYDKKNIIVVGTPTWSQDVDVVTQSPLEGDNICYTLHFYAATHKEIIQSKLDTAYEMNLPVLVTEFSICDASGSGSVDKKSGRKWMKILRKYKIGYVAWSLCNKPEAASLIKNTCTKTGNFKKSDLTVVGKFVTRQWKK